MIVRALEAVTWEQWAIIVLAGLWLTAPLSAFLDKRADERDRRAWSKQPGATR